MDQKTLDRFMSKVEKTDTCWLWKASLNAYGYANFAIRKNGKSFIAVGSRISYEHFKGPIPPGLCALHTCDVRKCVNPDHLFIGNKRENWDDMIKKRRVKNPEMSGVPNSKFTWRQARQIRSLYQTGDFAQRDLAKIYHVSLSVIQDLLNGQSYQEAESFQDVKLS